VASRAGNWESGTKRALSPEKAENAILNRLAADLNNTCAVSPDRA
jgi:hypothetical protein